MHARPSTGRRGAATVGLVLIMLASTATHAAAADPVGRRGAGGRAAAALIANQYYDECSDAIDFDLKKVQVIDDGEADVTFTWGTCPGAVVPATATAAITFLIDHDVDSPGPEMAIRQRGVDATWQLFDTRGAASEGAWVPIQAGTGSITRVGPEDGGLRDVGSLQFDAVAANFPLRYALSITTRRGTADHDLLPEPGMPPIAFPEGCDFFEQHAARVTSDGFSAFARGSAALTALEATAIRRPDGSRLAWPLDDAQLAALDRLPGVSARRPVMFRAMADPEPTQWALDQTRLPAAWQVVPRASGRIAVLDQGVDARRPDLLGHVAEGYDAITGEIFPAGHDSALGPHGTAVSGIIVGGRDNDVEVAGVNDGAVVVPVRVFDHSSCADDAAIAAGLDWARTHDTDVVNLSLGGPGSSAVLEAAINRAVDAGVLVIAATGNDDDVNPGEQKYPAAYPNVIGIGATGPDGVAFYSQRAATEFVAPGGAFTGQAASDYAILGEWDRVEFQAGTSFSSPFVAGLVSLWLRDHRGATVEQVRTALRAAAVDVPGTFRDGAGIIDAFRLLGTPPATATRVAAAPGIDGDPATYHRLDEDRAIEAALAVSARRFPIASTSPVAVLARSDNFADALSGAPLGRDGPLLFTATQELDVRVRNELQRVLRRDATIHLLGGPNAISPLVERQLREAFTDASIVRLAGADRYATSRAVVRSLVQRDGRAAQLLLARGHGPASDPDGTAAWADALAGASVATARRWPLLVVPTAGLTSADMTLITDAVVADGFVNLLGGPNALSEKVAVQAAGLRSARRFSGPSRSATAARIATTLWGGTTTGQRTFHLLNLHSPAGWYLGLASAGYAAQIDAPLLSVRRDDVPPETAALLSRCGTPQVETWVAGAASQISGTTVAATNALDGSACPG